MKKPLANPTCCPIRTLFDQFSDRWAIRVVLELDEGPVRFNALRRRLNGLTQKVLGQTLQRLERNGLVYRNVLASKPIAVEYQLTILGRSLLPLIHNLRAWTLGHNTELKRAQQEFDSRS